MDRRNFTKAVIGATFASWIPRADAEEASAAVGHPVFKPEATAAQLAGLQSRVRTILGLEESQLLKLIPTRTGFISTDCPNCDEGSQGGQLRWSIEEPSILTCRYCGHRYPSKRYPDDKVLEVKDPLGRVQQYPYYQDASGRKYFFQARLWRQARDYFMVAGYDLAQLAYVAGEKQAARKAALILDRFAELYPGFIVVRESQQDDQGFQERPPYETQGGKWGRWYFDEMPTHLIRAYDLIYPGGELEKLSQERGLDVRQRIEEDFFRATVRHVRTYPEYYGNPSPRIYEGLAVLGRVIGEPDYVHDAVRRMKGIFEKRFFFDGMWKEGTFGYHDMTLRGMERALDAVSHYSDPPGYLDPTDRRRFEGLNLETEIPTLALARKVTDRLRYPDGRYLPVHDAWARLRGADLKGQPLEFSDAALWPAMGHAYLGRGKGADQMQVHLHFGGGYGHAHNDSLTLALFAFGEELLPDLGYSHTRYRYWTRSTLGHNTVLVDGEEQHTGSEQQPSDGNLLLFLTAGDAFQIVEASGERAYAGRAKTYRRTLLQVGIDEKSAYVVDLFCVEGGKRHEWALHGSADRDQSFEVTTPLTPYGETMLPPGTRFQPPTGETETGSAEGLNPAYGFIREVRRGAAPPVLVGTFRPTGKPGPSLRVHSLPPAETEVFIGRAPSIRRADENDARVEQFWMPIAILRREGAALSTNFVSVLEPFAASPVIQRVERIELRGAGEALRVTGTNWTDTIVYRADDQVGTEAMVGRLRLKGRAAWVRERQGQVTAMHMVGGTELSFGSERVASFGILTGRVTAVMRKAAGNGVDAFQVEGRLPQVDLAGLTAIIRHSDGSTHGYPLTGTRREGGRTWLVLASEPGFEMNRAGASRFLFFPQREIEGEVTFSVAGLASWKK